MIKQLVILIISKLMVLQYLLHFNKAICSHLPLSDGSRRNIFLFLLVASVLGTLSFLVLRRIHREEEMLSEEEGQSLLSTRSM